MEIKCLDPQSEKKLKETQQYFYQQLNGLVKDLDAKYFDITKSFFHLLSIKNESVLRVKIIPKEISWFDIEINITLKEIIIYLDGWHENFRFNESSYKETSFYLNKFIIFVLSESCKLEIYESNKKPFKWILCGFEQNRWKTYSLTGLLFYNYFGRRSKVEKQSHMLKETLYPKELFSPNYV